MGFIKRLIDWAAAGEQKSYDQWSASSIRLSDMTVSSAIDYASLRNIADAVGHVDRCANMISKVASQHQPRLFRRGKAKGMVGKKVDRKTLAFLRGDGENRAHAKAMSMVQADDAYEIEGGDAVNFIRQPCPLYSGSEWRYLETYYMQICGDWWAHYAESPDGGLGLFPMLPQFVSLRLAQAGTIERVLYARDGSRRGGVGQEFDPEECFSWKFRPSRTSLYRGEGWLVGCSQEAQLLRTALLAQAKSWENMQRPDWVFMLPKDAPQAAIQDARQAIENRHSGPTRVMKPLVAVGADVKQLSWSPKDSMFDTQIDRMENAIRQAAGIPEPLFNMTDTTFANADTSVIIFARDTIQPLLNTVAEQDSNQLLPLLGLDPESYFIAYTDVVPESSADRTQKVGIAASVATINERRKWLGLEEVEWGDEQPKDPTASMFGGPSPVGNPPAKEPPPEPAEDADLVDPMEPEDDTKSITIPFTGYGDTCGHVHKSSPPNPLSESGIQRFADSLELWFRRNADRISINPNGQVDLGDAADELAKLMQDPLAAVSDRAITRVLGQFPDKEPMLRGEAMRAFNDTYRVQLARGITARLSADLTTAIQGGISSGGGLAETLAAVREKLPDEAGWRALRIANTETATMEAAASVEGWKQVGVQEKEWIKAGDCCPVCQSFAAQYAVGPKPVDHIYAPAGTTIVGSDGKSYTTYMDVKHEPLHPNCRCATIPVIGGGLNDE